MATKDPNKWIEEITQAGHKPELVSAVKAVYNRMLLAGGLAEQILGGKIVDEDPSVIFEFYDRILETLDSAKTKTEEK